MPGTNGTPSKLLRSHTDLDVYNMAFEAAMTLFELSKSFPREEAYSLTSHIRRSSRSVAANIVEAWRKRRYEAAFISKLADSEAEAAERRKAVPKLRENHRSLGENAEPVGQLGPVTKSLRTFSLRASSHHLMIPSPHHPRDPNDYYQLHQSRRTRRPVPARKTRR